MDRRAAKLKRPKLAEVARLFLGIPINRRYDQTHDSPSFPVVSLGDLDGGLVTSARHLPNIPLRVGGAVDQQILHEGDVLLSCRGTQFKAARVGKATVGAIPTSNLIVVRPGPQLLP